MEERQSGGSRLPSDVASDKVDCDLADDICPPKAFGYHKEDVLASIGEVFAGMRLGPEESSRLQRQTEGHHRLRKNSVVTFDHVITEDQTNGQPCLFQQNTDGDTLLHLCVIHGKAQESACLISSAGHPGDLDIVNQMHQSPLILAAHTGQSSLVDKLCEAGADAHLPDRHGDTPLHVACRNGDLETVGALTRKPWTRRELSAKNYDGLAPVHLATIGGHLHILSMLSAMETDMNDMEAKSGKTPLHLAIEYGRKETIRHLVEECGVDVNARTFYGLSPIMLAAERGMRDIMAFLEDLVFGGAEMEWGEASGGEGEAG